MANTLNNIPSSEKKENKVNFPFHHIFYKDKSNSNLYVFLLCVNDDC